MSQPGAEMPITPEIETTDGRGLTAVSEGRRVGWHNEPAPSPAHPPLLVISAKAGIEVIDVPLSWTPAFAGVTGMGRRQGIGEASFYAREPFVLRIPGRVRDEAGGAALAEHLDRQLGAGLRHARSSHRPAPGSCRGCSRRRRWCGRTILPMKTGSLPKGSASSASISTVTNLRGTPCCCWRTSASRPVKSPLLSGRSGRGRTSQAVYSVDEVGAPVAVALLDAQRIHGADAERADVVFLAGRHQRLEDARSGTRSDGAAPSRARRRN